MAVSSIYPVPIDYPELAVRLGSVDTFDRRGNVILIDNFTNGFAKWDVDGAVRLDGQYSRNGIGSAYLDAGTTLGAYLAFPTVSRMGVEFSFALDDFVTSFRLEWHLTDGRIDHSVDVQWIAATKYIQYWGSDGLWHDLVRAITLEVPSDYFGVLKVVVDYPNECYHRIIMNNYAFDMARIAYQKNTSLAAPGFWCEISTWGGGMWLDSAIITRDEPA